MAEKIVTFTRQLCQTADVAWHLFPNTSIKLGIDVKNSCYENRKDLDQSTVAAMGWSDQVHASRIQSTSRKIQSSQSNIPTPRPRKPNSSVLPIALVAGAVSSALWWRKGGHEKFKGKDPVGEIASFIKRLFGGSGKRLTQRQSGNWKANRPGNMAAAAATQRAQASSFFSFL
jgi:hypothetical protein